jgi:hypothetical protein
MVGAGRDPWGAGYDTAQVCLNGHPINASADTLPQHNQKFCEKCGEQTIMACPNCDSPIRGRYRSPAGPSLSLYAPPSFWHDCGHAYPWTVRRLKAARDLTHELERLNDNEREVLSKSLDDLIRDTPQTPLAATRFKRLVAKAGSGAAAAFRDILVDVLSETTKKLIWPS